MEKGQYPKPADAARPFMAEEIARLRFLPPDEAAN
jgi:hypothetical protein